MTIAYLSKVIMSYHWTGQVTYKVIMSYHWTGQVTYNGEDWIVDLQTYVVPHLDITRGVGRGRSYLAARDRAIENSGRAEGDWSRLLPELDEMVYEATSYQVPEVPVQGKES